MSSRRDEESGDDGTERVPDLVNRPEYDTVAATIPGTSVAIDMSDMMDMRSHHTAGRLHAAD